MLDKIGASSTIAVDGCLFHFFLPLRLIRLGDIGRYGIFFMVPGLSGFSFQLFYALVEATL